MEHIVTILEQYGYIALFPIAAVEGPVTALVVGFLIYLGHFHIVPAMLVLVLADFIPDMTYYLIGRIGNRAKFIEKYGRKFRFIFNNSSLIEKLWHNHPKKTMVITKLAYGLSTPLLISGGLVKAPVYRFALHSFSMSVFQYGIILLIGYSLGQSYMLAESYITNAGLVVAVIAVFLIVLYIYIGKRARKEIIKMENENS